MSTRSLLPFLRPTSPRLPRMPLKLSVLMLALLLAACGNKTDGTDTKAAAPATAAAAKKLVADPMLVDIKPEMAANFRIAPVNPVALAMVQELSGRIDANERLVTRIGAAVTGRVTDVLAEVGDHVRTGQTLARVASPAPTSTAGPRWKSNAVACSRPSPCLLASNIALASS